MSTAFLYAGQGAQHVGMGKDFYEAYPTYREFIDQLQEELKEQASTQSQEESEAGLAVDLKTLMHEGPLEELSKTENTQACMAAFAAGVTRLLEEHGIRPDVACGLSLGEYGALYAAGAYSAGEYVRLTAYRGHAMMEAARGCCCSMSAILGVDSQLVEEEIAAYEGEGYVTLANYNCPGQYVICGDETAVSAVEQGLKARGARKCVRLNVSGPFHTKYMQPAGEALKRYFAKMDLARPQIPVLANVTGDYYKEEDDIPELLVAQVQNSVRLEEALRRLIGSGVDQFIEIGPGNTIAGFLKKTSRAMKARIKVSSIDCVADFEKVVADLAES